MPDVLTVEETADVLRIGRSAAYAGVRSGDIPAIRVGRKLRVPRHLLERKLGINGSATAEHNDEAPAVTGAQTSTSGGGKKNARLNAARRRVWPGLADQIPFATFIG